MSPDGIRMWLTPMRVPQEPSFMTHATLGGCETPEWPLGSPPENYLLVSYLAQRDGSAYGSAIVPIGNTGPEGVCDSDNDIAGTEWTYIDSASWGTVSTVKMTFAFRDSAASEPAIFRWGGPGAMVGTSRPRSHSAAFAGLSGAPTVTVNDDGTGNGTEAAPYTSPGITVGAAGRIVAAFGYRCTGPADGFSPNISLTAQSPAVDMTQGWAFGGFGPYSWFGYRDVAGAGTYDIVLDRTNTPRDSIAVGWLMGFWPE